jgi:Zn-dependent protease
VELSSFLAFPLEKIPYVLFALILAFTVHELAHAYMAYKFGDPTAKREGRLTLNPLAHIDPIGTLMIFIAGFGWAKPVPVNRFYFSNPRLAGVVVSGAGPISNLILAFLFLFIWFLLNGMGWISWLSEANYDVAYQLFEMVIYLNVVLFVFNLLPFPPLDGYRIIEDLAPSHIRAKLSQYENYGIVFFLILVITPLGDYVFPPLFQIVIPAVMETMTGLVSPLW